MLYLHLHLLLLNSVNKYLLIAHCNSGLMEICKRGHRYSHKTFCQNSDNFLLKFSAIEKSKIHSLSVGRLLFVVTCPTLCLCDQLIDWLILWLVLCSSLKSKYFAKFHYDRFLFFNFFFFLFFMGSPLSYRFKSSPQNVSPSLPLVFPSVFLELVSF